MLHRTEIANYPPFLQKSLSGLLLYSGIIPDFTTLPKYCCALFQYVFYTILFLKPIIDNYSLAETGL